jgi:cysteine-S-conjugate beta-lyase
MNQLGWAAVAPPTLFDDLSLDELRARRSVKWRRYPGDVLPAWVAELDFPLAPPVHRALADAVARDDTGYANADGLPAAFAAFAAARWGWEVDPQRTLLVADIMSGVGELLRALTAPGDGVVVNPPVYPPFFKMVNEVGRELVEAPLGSDWRLDLDALESAFAAGARCYLLCSPHNPTGTVHTRDELAALAGLAERHDVLVISDEVHAPMTLPGAVHVPYLDVGPENGLALISASKAWNVPGLKCALAIAASERMTEALRRLPEHVPFHAGHFGVLANIAAFAEGAEWLDGLVAHLDAQRTLVAGLLAAELPDVRHVRPEAGYLVWLDCRELDLGDDPSEVFLERGRVALSPGLPFGAQGRGFARLNVGTSGALVAEAVSRMRSALDG